MYVEDFFNCLYSQFNSEWDRPFSQILSHNVIVS